MATRAIDKRTAVGLTTASEAGDGVSVSVTVTAITAEARGPGEVSGPALAVTVSIQNTLTSQGSLSNAAVTLIAADGSPGSSMSAPPATQLPASVAAGQTVSAVAVFTVPLDQRNPVTIEVSADPSTPTAVFRGPA